MCSPILLLETIIRGYLLKTYCLTVFTDQNLELNGLHDLPIIYYRDGNYSESILQSLSYGCSDFIISVRDPKTFVREYDEAIHVTNQRRGNRRLTFVPTELNLDQKTVYAELLKEHALNYVPDVLLLLPNCDAESFEDGCSNYDLGTQKYVGISGNEDLIILDTWHCSNESFQNNSDLFPDKLSNMEGRVVKMATFHYNPYSIFELDENDEIIGLDGTETKAAFEFCKWINCTVEIVRDDAHEWGEIWDNRSGNGILGNIVTDRADMGYGALYSWYHEFLFLDLTMPTVRTGITCIAPVPLLVARWLLPVLPFNLAMWSTVFAGLLIGIAGFYITGRRAKKPLTFSDSTIITLGIMLLQVPPFYKPPAALRHVLSWTLLLSLVVSNIYSGGLASTMTVPKYEDPINTVQELVDSNMNWGATHDAWIFSILDTDEPNMIHLVQKFKKWSDEKLRTKGTTRDFAYSVERLPAGHFAIGEYVTESSVRYLQLMVEDIYWEQSLFMARKSSPYTTKINLFFERLHQAGLPYSWETQVSLKHSNFAVQLAVKLSVGRHGDGNADPRPLEIIHIQGPIFFWLFGCVLAFLTFLCEASTKLYRPKKLIVAM